MLVLYVLTYLKLTNQQKATEQQLNKIKEIQAAVKELPKEYFQYDSIYKRFSLVQNVEFEKGKDIKVGVNLSKDGKAWKIQQVLFDVK